MRTRIRHHSRAATLARTAASLCLLGTLVGVAQAAPPVVSTGQTWQAVNDRRLDSLRGGFFLGGGLVVSFGITRSVFINGEMITSTTLNVENGAGMSLDWVARLREELQSLRLVQNGPGNTFVSGTTVSPVSAPGATAPTVSTVEVGTPGTVIQNSLNNQQILHQTVIDASSNALGLLRLSSLQSTLSEAIRQSIGQR
ncbi:hypothetical protein [Hydrogenophaga sp.]|uniref:hypothetical protein n=1 Tax=Hydrogenophaga sp. TaxID=1904254 RepID=UPI002FC6509B